MPSKKQPQLTSKYMMKTIVFDHQIFESQPFGGISKVYCDRTYILKKYLNCIFSIKASDNQALLLSNLVYDIKPIKHFNWGGLSNHHFPLKRTLTRILNNSNQNINNTKKILRKGDYDIFEPTYYNPYFLKYIKSKPFVIEIHDMIPEMLPHIYNDNGLVSNKRLLIEQATHIHTPSEKTKNDIVNLYGIVPEKITVVPHGVPSMPHDNEEKLFIFPYLLYVGARWDYKNFIPFLKEFAKITNDFSDLHLVCTGYRFTEEEKKTISDLKIQNKVHHFDPSISHFHSLYHNAVAFVFPSLYEGFGLPILEAWSCGCPVLLNNASCFPEVAGNAALYFELNERQNNFYEVFEQLWQMSSEDREKLINKGYERMKMYSWEESAKKLADIYNQL